MKFKISEKIGSMRALFSTPWRQLKCSKFVKRSSVSKGEGKLHDYQITVAAVGSRGSDGTGPARQVPEVETKLPVRRASEQHCGGEDTTVASNVDHEDNIQKGVDTEELLWNFGVYGRQLADAQHQLDIREQYFEQEQTDRKNKLEAGRKVETQTDLDIKQLQEAQKMTTFLIQAEKEYNDAKAALIAAGIQPPGSDIESGFVDDADDGYRISEEHESTECVDVERIQSWLAELPDVEMSAADFPEESATPCGEVDPWKFVEVEIWDSRSMIAEGAARRRIDKWRSQAQSSAPALHSGEFEEV